MNGKTIVNTCIFCSSNNTALVEEIKSPLNGKLYRLYNCYNCLIQFILPNVYEDVYTDGVLSTENSPILSSMDDYVNKLHKGRSILEPPTRQIIKELGRLKIDLKDKKILDIGAGDGINYEGLKRYFDISPNNYYVVECDKNSAAACKNRGLNNIITDYFSTSRISHLPSDFDIVIFTEVLEHQTDPADFLETVKSITRSDGLIFITVPNRKMLAISRSVFYADFPPHHFLRFDKRFFLKNFKEYEKLKVSEFPNPFVLIKKDRACRKVSSFLFKTDRLWILFYPFLNLFYLCWYILLLFRGNGIIVVLRKK